jgi:hypothetical protein
MEIQKRKEKTQQNTIWNNFIAGREEEDITLR